MTLGSLRLERIGTKEGVKEKPTIKFNFQSREHTRNTLGYFPKCYLGWDQIKRLQNSTRNSPTVPFQNAFGPSSAMIFLAASRTPV